MFQIMDQDALLQSLIEFYFQGVSEARKELSAYPFLNLKQIRSSVSGAER